MLAGLYLTHHLIHKLLMMLLLESISKTLYVTANVELKSITKLGPPVLRPLSCLPHQPAGGHSRVLVFLVTPVDVATEHPPQVSRHHPLVEVLDVEPRRRLAGRVAGKHRQLLTV